jgi:hypothetical protein
MHSSLLPLLSCHRPRVPLLAGDPLLTVPSGVPVALYLVALLREGLAYNTKEDEEDDEEHRPAPSGASPRRRPWALMDACRALGLSGSAVPAEVHENLLASARAGHMPAQFRLACLHLDSAVPSDLTQVTEPALLSGQVCGPRA